MSAILCLSVDALTMCTNVKMYGPHTPHACAHRHTVHVCTGAFSLIEHNCSETKSVTVDWN